MEHQKCMNTIENDKCNALNVTIIEKSGYGKLK